MTPIYFGPTEKPLYGVFHPAHVRAARAPAILLCNPFGVEAIRAFRIFRILAEKFAQAGSPALRFDYYGTGDSAGDCAQMSVAGATENILTAHQELIDISGANRVVWVGLRLGALFALLASQARPKGLAGLALWDPVVLGADYLRDLKTAHVAGLAQVFDQSEGVILSKRKDANFASEASGFLLGKEFRDQMLDFDLSQIASRPARSVAIITGEEQHELVSHLESVSTDITLYEEEKTQSWNADAAMNAFVVPVGSLDLVSTAVGKMR